MQKRSRYSYSDTLAKLSDAIGAAGNTIFATIDQSAAARDVGLTLRPTTLIVFGNPRAGTPLMDAFPLTGLELPLKLLVWEDGAHVALAYVSASEIAERYGVSGMTDRIAAIDSALDTLTGLVA